MKCLPAVLALVSIVACGPSTGRRVDESFQSARLAMWRGDLASALDAASRGLTLTESTPESEAAWRLRLLRAEILLTKPDLSQALPIAHSGDARRITVRVAARRVGNTSSRDLRSSRDACLKP